jgi:hypothetical protein
MPEPGADDLTERSGTEGGTGGAATGCDEANCAAKPEDSEPPVYALATLAELCAPYEGEVTIYPPPDAGCEAADCGETCVPCREDGGCAPTDQPHACSLFAECVPIAGE